MPDVRYAGPVVEITAGSAVNALRAVVSLAGDIFHADKDTPAHRGLVAGVSRSAKSLGEAVSVQVYGPLCDDTWTWTPDLPIYVGSDGVLTQTVPTTGWVQQIAVARTATEIFVDLQPVERTDVDKHYEHSQAVAASSWTVAHNLGKRPSVTVVDSAGTVVVGNVSHDSANQLTLTFSSGFAGTAYCN